MAKKKKSLWHFCHFAFSTSKTIFNIWKPRDKANSCLCAHVFPCFNGFLVLAVEALGPAPPRPTGAVLDVGTPFYQDGQLRVHVCWQTNSGQCGLRIVFSFCYDDRTLYNRWNRCSVLETLPKICPSDLWPETERDFLKPRPGTW